MSDSSNQSEDVGGEGARSLRDDRQLWREQTLRGLTASTLVAAAFAAVWFLLVPYGLPLLTKTLCLAVGGAVPADGTSAARAVQPACRRVPADRLCDLPGRYAAHGAQSQ